MPELGRGARPDRPDRPDRHDRADRADRTAWPARVGRRVVAVGTLAISGWCTAWLAGRAVVAVSGDRSALWLVGRAGGISAYLLVWLLVIVGLLLSHPWRVRVRRPAVTTRIRVHATLAGFALAFTVLHIVVLALDPYAGVGWRGALVPLGAGYRPVPVTLGLIGLWSGLASGLTAALAGRVPAVVWWRVHKVAGLALVLIWLHGVLAGSDTGGLRWGYLASGAVVLAVAISRYVAATPADRVAELADALGSADPVAVQPVTLRRVS